MQTGGHWNPVTRTSSKCKVCTSRYREEIEEKLNNKRNGVEISQWLLKQKPPEEISRHSIRNHFRKHGFKMRVIDEGTKGKTEVDERHFESLNDFLDLVIKKVHTAVESGTLEPTVLEGVRAAEIKGKIREGSKWEKEILAFFMGVSEKYGSGHSN